MVVWTVHVTAPASEGCLVRAHGLTIATEVDLGLPEAPGDRADLELTTVPEAPRGVVVFERKDDPAAPIVVERWHADGWISVAFSHGGTFRLTEDRVELVGGLDDVELRNHLFLDHVLPRAVALRGDLALHASGAVAPSGRAHLFLGTTGAGKSTCALALARAGWQLLDDDGVRVQATDSGFLAHPGHPIVRLLPESAALFGAAGGTPIASGHRKHRFDARDLVTVAPAPAVVAAVHVLDWGQPAHSGRRSYPSSVGAVAANAFHMHVDPHQLASSAFSLAAALCDIVPVYDLRRPRDFTALDDAVELLEELDLALGRG